MACYTVVRSFVLLFSMVALALAVVGVFFPFFRVPSDKATVLQNLQTSLESADFKTEAAVAMLQRYVRLSSTAPAKSTMTLWTLKYGTAVENTTSLDLREEYFSCYNGNVLIQTAEGLAVVTCVLGAANFILAMFSFTFSAVVKFPLALYFFLSAGAAAGTFGIMLHLYLHGWCGDNSLKSTYWDLYLSFVFYVASCALSLISSVMTMFID